MKQQKKKTVLCLLAGLVLCGVFLSLTAGEPAVALEGREVQPLSNQTTPEDTDIAKETLEQSTVQSTSTSTVEMSEKKETEKIPISNTSSPTEEESIPAPEESAVDTGTVAAEQHDPSVSEIKTLTEQEESPPEVVSYITTLDIPQDEHDAYLIERWLVDGKYPRNQFGESYGPQSLAKYAGEEPDLIPVRATNGEWGYACAEDFNGPEINTLEEAAAYMENLPDSRAIPVYDLEGNVIGEFVFESGTLSDDEIREALDR